MARYREGFQQVVLYLPNADHQKLHAYWLRSTDKSLAACAARLLLEQLAQVDLPAALPKK